MARDRIPFVSLVSFVVITFAMAWGILALYIFLPQWMAATFGQLSGNHPLFFLAVWAPAIAAFIVIGRRAGFGGLRRFVSRALLWRTGFLWYLFMLIVVPAVFYAGSALKGNLLTDPFPFATVQSLVTALLLGAVKGPIEEFGWRGYALPMMQRKMAPFPAALILGMLWAFWHLPAFIVSGTQQNAWSFMPFFIGTVTISLIMTALYNASRGSILLSALLHFQFMNPIWPDAQPYDSYLLTGVAVIVLWVNRRTMFRKDGGLTEIVPRADGQTAADADGSVTPAPAVQRG